MILAVRRGGGDGRAERGDDGDLDGEVTDVEVVGAEFLSQLTKEFR